MLPFLITLRQGIAWRWQAIASGAPTGPNPITSAVQDHAHGLVQRGGFMLAERLAGPDREARLSLNTDADVALFLPSDFGAWLDDAARLAQLRQRAENALDELRAAADRSWARRAVLAEAAGALLFVAAPLWQLRPPGAPWTWYQHAQPLAIWLASAVLLPLLLRWASLVGRRFVSAWLVHRARAGFGPSLDLDHSAA